MRANECVAMILDSVGEFMRLETTDGTRREGKISGLTCRAMKVNGKQVDWPIEIEINGDPGDRIPIDRILRISIG